MIKHKFYLGDAKEILKTLPDNSIQTCVTSPPYWGLRDYGLPPAVWGGDKDCAHEWRDNTYQRRSNDGGESGRKQTTNAGAVGRDNPIKNSFCQKCGAWLGCLGLEPTPELYVQHLVEIFKEVRRTLRDDGTIWVNLGDSYNGSGGAGGDYGKGGLKEGQPKYPGRNIAALKPKDLCGIPWTVAFALRDDGWYLRMDIVWAKPNPMPESVTDRPTKAHEYIFLMSKSQQYFYDHDAIREPVKPTTDGSVAVRPSGDSKTRSRENWGVPHEMKQVVRTYETIKGANKRSVWTVATKPYPEAHFATFPPKLIEPCILAGSRKGDTVLDPFAGSGTTNLVAQQLGRNSVYIDCSEKYLNMALKKLGLKKGGLNRLIDVVEYEVFRE